MRVLVATGAFKHLTSAQTGAAMARAWAELGVQCAVVPMAEVGDGFDRAWADLTDGGPLDGYQDRVCAGPAGIVVRHEATHPAEAHDPSSSGQLGTVVQGVVSWSRQEGHPLPELWLEVPDWTWADGGEGFWRATEHVHDVLRGLRLHLVTSSAQAQMQLTGLRGITAATMHTSGAHPGELLAADQRLVDWCGRMGDDGLGTRSGSGAVGGLGAAVLALGGDVVTGPDELVRLSGLQATMEQADLVVTGYDELDFGSKGGDLVPTVTRMAEVAARPVVALARRNWISPRELRTTMTVEQAYSLQSEQAASVGALDEGAITEACRTVAASWHW